MATNQTLIHYALDLEQPPVTACGTPATGAITSPTASEVTCPRCLASEHFPVSKMHGDPPLVTPYDLLMEAASLLSEDGENVEYDRAIVELTANLMGGTSDDHRLVRRILRALKNGE